MENNDDELNKLKIENEIKKMKLSLEHGANFLSSKENKLPPRSRQRPAGGLNFDFKKAAIFDRINRTLNHSMLIKKIPTFYVGIFFKSLLTYLDTLPNRVCWWYFYGLTLTTINNLSFLFCYQNHPCPSFPTLHLQQLPHQQELEY